MGDIQDIFRAYDIRGNAEKELTPEVMEKIGKAYGTFLGSGEKVVLGHDARNSSEELSEAFIRGLRSTDVDEIVDLGLEPFGVVLFYGWEAGYESAFITASHLPPEWNGVKFYHPDGVGFLEEENHEIRDIFLKEEFAVSDSETEVVEKDFRQEYIDYVVSKIGEREEMKVLMDCGNGVAGLTAPEVFRKLGFEVDVLNEEPDGDFPSRESDVNDESISELREKVRDYDIGVAYDGDSDRCFLITPEGRLLKADETAYIVLDKLLEKVDGNVIANVECSRRLEQVAEKHGSTVKRVRVGHTYLFKAIRDEGAVFGVEKAGHFAVPEIFPLDDGVAASAFFTAMASLFGSFEEEVERMPKYYGDRIPFECPDSEKFDVVRKLQKQLSEEYENTSTVDGIRVEKDEGWILIRASNTSPKIRITVEAETEEDFESLRKEFSTKLEKAIEEA